jgi:hypothetical protein
MMKKAISAAAFLLMMGALAWSADQSITQQRILAEVGKLQVQLSVMQDYAASLEQENEALKKSQCQPKP